MTQLTSKYAVISVNNKIIHLHNNEMTVSILPLGASIQSIYLKGYEHSLVLGSSSLKAYAHQAKYFGAIVGRVANRTAFGHAQISEQAYSLPATEPEIHHLHGGPLGTASKNWIIINQNDEQVHLQTLLFDGEMGYPGNMIVNVFYRLNDSTLEIDIRALTDQTTLCNFAGHSYFNLDGGGSILDHQLKIQAEHYLPVDDTLIPTGELKSVENTPFDFRTLSQIRGENTINLDTNFCLSQQKRSVQQVATLIAPKTGITLELETNETGLQVYDGRHIQIDANLSINKEALNAYSGLAMEAQGWPDAINQAHFPSILLSPNEHYQQITRYRFC